jgi:hypothetical protein
VDPVPTAVTPDRGSCVGVKCHTSDSEELCLERSLSLKEASMQSKRLDDRDGTCCGQNIRGSEEAARVQCVSKSSDMLGYKLQ